MARHYNFGTGDLFATTAAGPVQFGALQDVSVDFSATSKALYGSSAFPLDTARGKQTISGKATVGQLDPYLLNNVFFGQTLSPGQSAPARNEILTGSASAPVANASTFVEDLGVAYATTGAKLQQVAPGAEAVGSYSVTSGAYKFAGADIGQTFVVSYLYTVTTGSTLTIKNQLMGDIPVFRLDLGNRSKGKPSALTLFACTSSKLTAPFKQEDYLLMEMDFMAQDNGAGLVVQWGMAGG